MMCGCGPANRSGFTILELMMVLAVMTIIMSLGVPSVTRMMARARFKDGVFALQTELSRIRLLSMQSGEAYLFRYKPNTGSYQIVSQKEVEQKRDQANNLFNPSDLNTASFGPEQALPNEVIFTGGLLSESTGVRLASSADSLFGSSAIGTLKTGKLNPSSVSEWSEPIIFYPNGRTSNAVIFLASSGNNLYYSEVSIRGLTGGVRVSTISAQPPGSPEFPSVLPPETFAALNRSAQKNQMPGTLSGNNGVLMPTAEGGSE